MERDNLHIFNPVIISIGDANADLIINSVEEAAEELLSEWPIDDSDRYYEAVKACLDCITSDANPDVARTAFVQAAEEAGLAIKGTISGP
ncbi:DUF982 domain-containing protein [Aliirhizobium cellulosilyticum]|uniref:H2-forming N5,N10-methylenetetrahydromethanopterin dehydrogenase-like enzyme n=1 Tax=Aliirhizobium cellulosilyticum TaxID=393664 RepID=A0A7W6TFB8_9HYPH|nr:DUF982 domain-containing protein [Rhizobium cellulosilyticum]MBB4349322.1 H2-forming N5,N10-methylenetetrahydromethanopterin dehydrogenase-like enzyme [Rhizobium cellulosilyticum]MBB4412456.1 H2-forming N5,N10-methylenetetrahydromethanopterin dehydrogenase-like enzyme [Rhizobium cellulosilyticum]MBB4447088.1 H2-forming N5,N10-methylenetetrahydromethanopterin dehydrogenase-like enzyme [Rhizobium cellulosilyticum]